MQFITTVKSQKAEDITTKLHGVNSISRKDLEDEIAKLQKDIKCRRCYKIKLCLKSNNKLFNSILCECEGLERHAENLENVIHRLEMTTHRNITNYYNHQSESK